MTEEHQHLYHPAQFDIDSGTPLGPFTCSGCGDIQLTLPANAPMAPATLAPPPPLPSTITPMGNLPEDLQTIPENTRALALQLYRDHGVRVASQMTGLERDVVRELAIFELRSYRASRRQLRREYLKELLLKQSTAVLEHIDDAHSTSAIKDLAEAAGKLIDRLRLESGEASEIVESRNVEDPLAKLTQELEEMSKRVHEEPDA